MESGGIALCGGQSTRMGRSKPTLPVGPETMLRRVVRLPGQAVDEIVVVAGREQDLPDLSPGNQVLYDRQEGSARSFSTTAFPRAACRSTICATSIASW